MTDKEETIQYANEEIKRLNADVEELTAKISVRDKLLDIAETRINATEKHCQYFRKLYNEKVCLCEEQKAEIERLTEDSKRLKKVQMQLDDAMKMYHVIKAEAVKEFAERLKDKAHFSEDFGEAAVACYDIDNLAKQMVGDDNNCPLVDNPN